MFGRFRKKPEATRLVTVHMFHVNPSRDHDPVTCTIPSHFIAGGVRRVCRVHPGTTVDPEERNVCPICVIDAMAMGLSTAEAVAILTILGETETLNPGRLS